MEYHEIANIFPLISGDEFESLKKDIKKNGLIESIWTYENKILDGRNRYRACNEIGITPDMREFTGDDPLAFVISLNMKRRHLSASQLAFVALAVEEYEGKKAKEREQIRKSKSTVQKVAQSEQGKSRDIAAKSVGVNRQYVSDAKKIRAERPDLEKKVVSGEMNIKQAVKEIKGDTLEKKKKEFIESTKKDIVNKPLISKQNAASFLESFMDGTVSLLITDPPYSTDIDDIHSFVDGWLNLALKKIKPDGRAYICIGAYPEEIHAYLDVLINQDKFIVDSPLIWTYRNTLGITPKMKYNLNYQMILHLYSQSSKQLDTSITNHNFSVQDINAPDGRLGDRVHKWQKPSELAARLITQSTEKDDVVIDCFAGSGTFLIEAARLGRVASGCDIDDEAINICIERGCERV